MKAPEAALIGMPISFNGPREVTYDVIHVIAHLSDVVAAVDDAADSAYDNTAYKWDVAHRTKEKLR